MSRVVVEASGVAQVARAAAVAALELVLGLREPVVHAVAVGVEASEARVRLLVARLQRVEHLASGVGVTGLSVAVVGECGECVLHGASETRVLRLVVDELALEPVALVDERAQSGLLVCARV